MSIIADFSKATIEDEIESLLFCSYIRTNLELSTNDFTAK